MIVELAWDDAAAVTLSDTDPQYGGAGCAAFVVTAAGVVRLVTARGQVVDVPAAAGIPVRLAGVAWFKSTGSTATGIVALFDAAHPRWAT